MNKSDLLNILLSDDKRIFNFNKVIKDFNDVFEDFYNWNFPINFKLSQKVYHYLYDDKELNIGTCRICGKRCLFKSMVDNNVTIIRKDIIDNIENLLFLL